jgi:hypothetical protein
MFSRWPRYLSHGPAIEMWSVVHLPLAFSSTGRSEVVVAVPRVERLEQLQAVAGGRHLDLHAEPSAGGAVKVFSPGSKPWRGSTSPTGGRADLGAVGRGERVGGGVEVEATGEREGDDGVGRGHEAERVGRAVVALREVAVVAELTMVFGVSLSMSGGPLADARAAGVGEHGGADGLEVGEQAVALDGGADLLGAGGDEQLGLGRQALGRGLAGDRGGAGDVLVGRVGAASR